MYTLRGAGFSLKIYDNFKGGAPEETVFNIPSMCPGDHQISRLNDSLIPMRPNLAESFSAEVSKAFNTASTIASVVCRTCNNNYNTCMHVHGSQSIVYSTLHCFSFFLIDHLSCQGII